MTGTLPQVHPGVAELELHRLHDRGEFLGRHAGMACYDDLMFCRFTACESCVVIRLEQGGEGFLALPLRMLGAEQLELIQGEEKLGIDQLLGPEGAVVIGLSWLARWLRIDPVQPWLRSPRWGEWRG